jgi:hypothetical protein
MQPIRPLSVASKSFQGFFLIVADVEQLIQFGDGEDFVNVWPNAAESQLSFGPLDLLIHRNEFAKRGARQIFHVGKIENDFLATILIDEAKELVTDDLNVRFVEDLFVNELRDCHVADFLDVDSPLTTGCHFCLPILFSGFQTFHHRTRRCPQLSPFHFVCLPKPMKAQEPIPAGAMTIIQLPGCGVKRFSLFRWHF